MTYTATDASGNVTLCNFNVTITDDEAPSVNCPADLTLILDDPNTIILDVREGQELRESGKIKGAIHVPRGLLEFVFRPEDYVEDPEKIKILVYCAAGARAALAAKTLLYLSLIHI